MLSTRTVSVYSFSRPVLTRVYTMKVTMTASRSTGPAAALHGDEINGVEVIRRLLRRRVLDRLRGLKDKGL